MALQTKNPSTAIISSVGSVPSGGTTSSTRPVITGTADAGNIVEIYDGIRPLGSVVADANGMWTFTPTADIKAGKHSFAAIAHDTDNNFGASSALVTVTITPTAVTPPTPTVTDDHGLPIVAGGTTADAHPQISGSGPAGDIITVYDGATPIGSVKIGGDGKWSFTPTTDLSNAAHAITVTDKPAGGTEGPHSGTASFTVDTTVPAAPTITAGGAWDGNTLIGLVPSGSVTSQQDINLNGRALPGTVVYVYDGNTLIGSVVSQKGNGAWNFEDTAFAVGSHDISATVKNAAGTESAHSNHWTFTVDTSIPKTPAAPTLTDDSGLPIIAGSTTADTHPHINGGGSTPGDIIKVLDNGKEIGSTVVKPDGTWSFTPVPDLNSGPHDITVIDTNAAGTPSLPSNPTHITIDTSVPGAPATPVLTDDNGILIPGGSTTNDAHPHISGTGIAGDTIRIYDGATVIGSAKVGGDGKWTFTPTTDLSNATHSISVTDVNPAGTESPHSNPIGFTVDTSLPNAPTITEMNDYRFDNGALITAVPSGSTVTSANVAFAGHATANGVVYVYDGATMIASVKADATGFWFYASKTYTNGLHDMSATQKSPAGVETAHSNHWSFTLNATVPATPAAPVFTNDAGATIPSGSTTNDAHPHISGTGAAGDVITVFDNGTIIGSTTVAGNGTWSFTPATDLGQGTNAITVIETNPSGNPSAVSPPASLVIDTSTPAKPPVPVLTDDSGASIPAGSTTNDGHPHISGTGTAGDIITVFDGLNPIGSVKIGGDGKWTFTPATDVSAGAHSISVTDTNAAGTTGPKSDAIAFTFSLQPAMPVITSIVDSVGDITGVIVSGGVTDDPRPTISGTGIPGYMIYIWQNNIGCGGAVVDATGHWTMRIPANMADGVHAMTASQLANVSATQSEHTAPWTITIDTSTPKTPAAPTLTDDGGLPIAAGSTTADPHPHINGGGATPGDIIKVMDNGTIIGSTTVKPDGTWSFTPTTDMSSGAHDITATETNAAGKPSLPSDPTHITIDTSTPAKPPVPVLTDDSGALIPAGSTTTDGHPHISGTGTAGDIIKVYDGATQLGSVKIGGDGKWTFTPATDLSTGAHSISVTDTNAAGTTGPKSDSIAFNLALVAGAPAITSVVDAVGTITGPIVNGGVTDDARPTLNGTGVAGNTVYIFQNGSLCGQTTVDGTGHWSIKLTGAMADGVHAMTATQFSGSNPQSPASNAWTITVDTSTPKTPAAPTLTDDSGLPIVAGGTTPDAHPHINGGGATPGDIIKVLDNGKEIGSTTVKPDGTWSFTPSPDLNSGPHDITVTDTNAAGTPSLPSNPTHITIDTSTPAKPPVPVLTDDSGALIPAGSTTTDGHPHISGTGVAGDIITVYDGATALGSVKIGGDGKWTFTPASDLPTGSHSISVTDTNAAGTTGPHSDTVGFNFSLVPGAPVITVLVDATGPNTGNIAQGALATDSQPTIKGTGHAGDKVTVYDGATLLGSTTVGSDGTWTFKPATALAYGSHSLTATESNASGTSVASSAYTFKNTGVMITGMTDRSGHAIGNGGSTDGEITVTGWIDPAALTNGSVRIFMSGGTIGVINAVSNTGTTIDGSTFTFKINTQVSDGILGHTGIGPGTYTIDVQGINGAFTKNFPGLTWTVTDSFTAPTIPAAPAIPVLTDDSGAVIPAGSTTNDGHPHISGTGTSGDVITVYDGANAIGSVKIGSDGKWTFTPASDLSAGTHSISVTDTNAAGTSPKSGAIAFTFSLQPGVPVITSVVDSVGDITGPIPNGGVTDDARPTISGTGIPGYTVSVWQNGSGCAAATVDATGHWTVRIPADMSDGVHAMQVSQAAYAGASASDRSAAWTITVDTSTPKTPAAPTLTDDGGLPIAAGSTTADAHPHINGGGATPGDIIKVMDNGTIIGSTTVKPDGTWSFTPTTDMSSGGHDITVTDTNAAGKPSLPSNPTHITIDTSTPAKPPVPVLTDDSGALIPAGSTTNDGHPHISGTGVAGDIIKVYDGSTMLGSVKIGGDGKWTFTPATDVSTGAHSISVTDTNAAGTTGPKSDAISFTYALPLGVPVITSVVDSVGDITGPIPNGGVTDDARPTISGTGIPGYTVSVWQNGSGCAAATVDATGHWTVRIPADMSEGVHAMQVSQAAYAGAPASDRSAAWTITVDTSTPKTPAAPTLTDDGGLPIAAGSTTADAHPHISGGGATPGDIIKVMDNGTIIGSTTVKPDGTWSFTPTTDMSSGGHDITVTDTNAAGKPSLPSNPTHITIDTSTPAKPPVPVLTDDSGALIPAGSTTNDGHPHISGTGKAGDIITVFDGSTQLGSVKIGGDGKWTFTPATDVSAGAHSISVTDTNAAGTTGPRSDAIAFNYSLVLGAPVIQQGIIYDIDHQNVPVGPLPEGNPVVAYSQVKLSGTAEANVTVFVYDGATAIGSVVSSSTGAWSFIKNYANGSHDVSVTQKSDTSPESAHSNHWTFSTLVGTPDKPAIPVLTDDSGALIPAGSTTNDGHPHISGTGTAGDIITVFDGATALGSVKIGGDGKWTFTPATDISTGSHSISVTDTNAAGTTGPKSDSIAFTYSLVAGAPVITSVVDSVGTITGPIVNGGLTDDARPTLNGTGVAGNTINIYQNGSLCGQTTVDGTGHWTIHLTGAMSDGLHVMTATQAVGNNPASVASNAWSITVDTSVPATPDAPMLTNDAGANIPAGSTTNDAHPYISGKGKAGDIITVYDGSTKLGSTTIAADGTWTFKPSSDLSQAAHDFAVKESNPAGGTSAMSDATHIVIDKTMPSLDMVSYKGLTYPMYSILTDVDMSNAITVTGTGVPGTSFTLTFSGTPAPVTVDADGTWTRSVWSPVGGYLSITIKSNNVVSDFGGIFLNPSSKSPGSVTVTSFLDSHGSPIEVGGVTSEHSPVVTGTGTAGDRVFLMDGNTCIGSATVSANGSWILTGDKPLGSGDHNLAIMSLASKSQGNLVSVGPFAVDYEPTTFNSAVTSLGVAVPSGGIAAIGSFDQTIAFSGHGDPGWVVTLYADGSKVANASYTIGSDGTWIFPAVSMVKGNHDFYVTQTSPKGIVGPASQHWSFKVVDVVSSSLQHADSVDDHALAVAVASTDTDTDSSTAVHHTAVDEHGTFHGTTADRNETVDLNVDPSAYFKQVTAHIEGTKGGAIDTLHLTGDHQILDLTSLTGKTASAKISGIEVIDLGGQHNTLKLSLTDVLNLGEADLFMKDGKQQMMVQGKEGDEVDLSNSHIAGLAEGEWQAHGTAQVGGVTYNVYEHSGAHTELLVQQGVQIVVH